MGIKLGGKMQITVKGKNVEVTDSMRAYAEKRIEKIAKFYDNIMSAEVTMLTERSWHIVDVTVYGNGFVIRGEERTNDAYTSIDKVLDKLEKQVKKEKDKWRSRAFRQKRHSEGEYFSVENPRGDDDEEFEPANVIMTNPHIVSVPMFAQKPMTIEEAIKEMESLSFTFFVFYNAETEGLNIIYRRKDGFGLIDPSLEPRME